MSAPAPTDAAPVAAVEPVAPPQPIVAPPAATGGVATLDAWGAAKRHTITLVSGVKVEIEIPDLPNLIRTGAIPNALVSVAIGVANGKKVTAEDIAEQAAFFNHLVSLTVVNPSVTEQQVDDGLLPAEDKEMIVEFAVRQRDFDAVGHHLGGLETDAEFRNFRGLLPLDTFGGGV